LTGTPQVQHRAIPDIKVNGIDTPPSAGSPLAIRHLKFTPTPSNLVNDTGSFHGSVKSLQPNKVFIYSHQFNYNGEFSL